MDYLWNVGFDRLDIVVLSTHYVSVSNRRTHVSFCPTEIPLLCLIGHSDVNRRWGTRVDKIEQFPSLLQLDYGKSDSRTWWTPVYILGPLDTNSPHARTVYRHTFRQTCTDHDRGHQIHVQPGHTLRELTTVPFEMSPRFTTTRFTLLICQVTDLVGGSLFSLSSEDSCTDSCSVVPRSLPSTDRRVLQPLTLNKVLFPLEREIPPLSG